MDTGNAVDWKEKIMVYPLPNMDGTTAMTFLRELIPEAKLAFDATAKTLTVRARAKDHEEIAEVVRQMQAGGDPASRAESAGPSGAV